MIHLPIYRHVRRFLASMVIFGSTVLVMLWLPVKLIRWSMPGFLPYNVMLSRQVSSPSSSILLFILLLLGIRGTVVVLVNRSTDRFCTRGMIHNKTPLISPV